jgi:hypothetical protein
VRHLPGGAEENKKTSVMAVHVRLNFENNTSRIQADSAADSANLLDKYVYEFAYKL